MEVLHKLFQSEFREEGTFQATTCIGLGQTQPAMEVTWTLQNINAVPSSSWLYSSETMKKQTTIIIQKQPVTDIFNLASFLAKIFRGVLYIHPTHSSISTDAYMMRQKCADIDPGLSKFAWHYCA